MKSRALQLAGLVALATLLAGCAFNYVAADGSRHVIGFVHAVLPPLGPVMLPAASVRTQTVGLSYVQGDVGSSLTLGYSDITLAWVREDTCVRWPLVSGAARPPERKPQ